MPPRDLTTGEMLQRFVRKWVSLIHDDIVKEQDSAQSFLKDLLDFYKIDLPPGKIFEQHPFKLKKPTNGALFGDKPVVEYSQERMDMYIPEVCVWEMKGPAEKLENHIAQAFRYWVPMQTRYVVLCNFREFWVFDTSIDGGTREPKFVLKLEDLPANPEALAFLRGDEPHVELHSERVTRTIAADIGRVIDAKSMAATDQQTMRERLTKFALECVFAMFAEDTDLIPPTSFTVAMQRAVKIADLAPVYNLFRDFDEKDPDKKFTPGVPYINGPLYDSNYPPIDISANDEDEGMLVQFHRAAQGFNWEEVRPEVFGSIFEQALDPHKRHELGAHFTAHQDIMKVVGPTIVRPWQERINATKNYKDCEALMERMQNYHILDPACGCGNFLYVAYREMKRLERALGKRWELLHNQGLKRRDRRNAPAGAYFTIQQLHGIDVQEWAVMLTRVVLWIAEHLANRELGRGEEMLPLKDLSDNIVNADALFTDWFRPDDDSISELAIVGNPPFMGRYKLRQELGDEHVDKMHKEFPEYKNADLVTYWYAQALMTLKENERAGFVSSNSLSQNENREVSTDKIIAGVGTIIDAWKSYAWPGEAAVHVSIINWVMNQYGGAVYLDGKQTKAITPYLTSGTNISKASNIIANNSICFKGVEPGNSEFIITRDQASEFTECESDSDMVVIPWIDGRDINRNPNQSPSRWIIDFNEMKKEEAENFSVVFGYLQKILYPIRSSSLSRKLETHKKKWWQFHRSRPAMREAIANLETCLIAVRHAPHLYFTRISKDILPSDSTVAIALDSYYHYGVLQSAVHEYWAWARGSTLEERLRYTNTTIFETFPFPMLDCRDPFVGKENVESEGGASASASDSDSGTTARRGRRHIKSRGRAARSTQEIEPMACGDSAPPLQEIYNPRIVPDTDEAKRVSEVAEKLYTKRQAACKSLNLGLTKVYNYIKGKTALDGLSTEHQVLVVELQNLHEQLNNAVCACYGWPEEAWRDENEVLKRLLALNLALSG